MLNATAATPHLAGHGLESAPPWAGKRSGQGDDDLVPVDWPGELPPEAYHGLAGELVHSIEPHSEADPAALLVQFLIAFGNAAGRRAHFMAEADRHFTNLFCVIVGQTAKARKGTSLGQVQRVMSAVDAAWNEARVMSGLSSGEGLIWAVRDEIHERIPVRERGRTARYEDVVSDHGELDKRLLVVEPEFARVLQVTERETNTLSAILRQAWDTGDLPVLTKKPAARASGAHISLIGHITKDELRRLLTDTAAGNGFANRFLWICARRSKLLPEGGAWHLAGAGPLVCRLRAAAEFSRAAARNCPSQPLVIVRQQLGRQFLKREQFLFPDVVLVVLRETINKNCPSARLEHNQRPKSARLALAGARDPLFDDAAGKIGTDQTSFCFQILRDHEQPTG